MLSEDKKIATVRDDKLTVGDQTCRSHVNPVGDHTEECIVICNA